MQYVILFAFARFACFVDFLHSQFFPAVCSHCRVALISVLLTSTGTSFTSVNRITELKYELFLRTAFVVGGFMGQSNRIFVVHIGGSLRDIHTKKPELVQIRGHQEGEKERGEYMKKKSTTK